MDVHVQVEPRRESKEKSKFWISPAISNSFQIKNKVYKKYIESKSLCYLSKFEHYRKSLTIVNPVNY